MKKTSKKRWFLWWAVTLSPVHLPLLFVGITCLFDLGMGSFIPGWSGTLSAEPWYNDLSSPIGGFLYFCQLSALTIYFLILPAMIPYLCNLVSRIRLWQLPVWVVLQSALAVLRTYMFPPSEGLFRNEEILVMAVVNFTVIGITLISGIIVLILVNYRDSMQYRIQPVL